jgi:hypothetical protein
MTRAEFVARFPHATETVIRLNCSDYVQQRAPAPAPVAPAKPSPRRALRDPKLEPNPGSPPVVPTQGPALYSGRVHVRITVFRKRLVDPCNECSKWLVDCLRYFRILKDDRLSDIALSVAQEQARSKEEERTEIVIEPITNLPHRD